MREKAIEQKLMTAVRQAGEIATEFVLPGTNRMLDRLILLPSVKIGFVKVKAQEETHKTLQISGHDMLHHDQNRFRPFNERYRILGVKTHMLACGMKRHFS